MSISIRTNGDPIERQNADYILTSFPAYDSVWSKYIGNDGESNPIKFNLESEEEFLKRKLFGQKNYTVFISVLSLKRICSNFPNIKWDELGQTDSVLCLIDNVIIFFAHIGRIRDSLKNMLEYKKLSTDRITNDFDSLWRSRCIALHDAQFPFYFFEGLPTIPEFQEPASKISWADGQYYKDMDKDSFEFVDKTFQSLFDDSLVLINTIYYAIHSQICTDVAIQGLQFINVPNEGTIPAHEGTSSLAPNPTK